jgi:hypothetical protein
MEARLKIELSWWLDRSFFQKLFLLSALACLLTSRFSMLLCGFYGRPKEPRKSGLQLRKAAAPIRAIILHNHLDFSRV